MKQRRGTFSYEEVLQQRRVFSELDAGRKGLDASGMELFRQQVSYPFKEEVVAKVMSTWGKPIQYSQFINLYHGLRKKVHTIRQVEHKMFEEFLRYDLGEGVMSKDDFIQVIGTLMPSVTEKELGIILFDIHDQSKVPGDTVEYKEYLATRYSLF